MSTQLVNWSPNEKKFLVLGSSKKVTQSQYKARLTDTRPVEIKLLIIELDRMWKGLGADKQCASCFKGELSRPAYAHGCCGSCPNLGATGCVAKPLDCAVFTCGEDHFKHLSKECSAYRKGQLLMIADVIRKSGLSSGYFAEAYLRECTRKWTKEELAVAVWLRRVILSIY